jgi:hypothetical protein
MAPDPTALVKEREWYIMRCPDTSTPASGVSGLRTKKSATWRRLRINTTKRRIGGVLTDPEVGGVGSISM